jgi:hypothetical protein
MIVWNPLFCGCEVRYDEFVAQTLKICPAHASFVGTGWAHYQQLLADSRLWNDVFNQELVQATAKFAEIDPETGTASFKRSSASWQFVNGAIHVTINETLTNPERNRIVNALQNRFGNQVVLV